MSTTTPTATTLTARAKKLQSKADKAKERARESVGVFAKQAQIQFEEARVHLARVVYQLKHDQLYKETGLSWTAFTNKHLGMSRNHANVLVHMTRIRSTLQSFGADKLPDRLSQIKALRPYEGEELHTIWTRALAKDARPSRQQVYDAAKSS